MRTILLSTILFSFLPSSGQLPAVAEEQEVLRLLNLARVTPASFLKEYLLPYLQENKIDNGYSRSLIEDLKNASAMAPLELSKRLTESARYHAKDMGKSGKTGHNSTNGDSFRDRVVKIAKADYGTIGENCDYGNNEALGIVMSLLIDEDIPSLGHRKNILQPAFKLVGIAIEPHKVYEANCVMDFADKI